MDHDRSTQRLETSLKMSNPMSLFKNALVEDLSLVDNTTMRFSHDVTLRQLLHDTSLTMPLKTQPVVEALEHAFFEVFQDCTSTGALDTVAKLIHACTDVSECIESWNRYEIQNAWLAEETNTWKLLHCLYSDSLLEKKDFLDLLGHDLPEISQKKLVNILFQSDEELRLFQLLVDWLESCAASQDEAMPAFGKINSSVHWENTLHFLMNSAKLFDKKSNNLLVSRVDPDARHRQKKNIHALDQQDDDNLCRRIFKEIRCGHFKEAVDICMSSGQMWRGAVLQGWRILDFNYTEGASLPDVVGNPRRDLWKLSCMGILNNPNENIYFKAALGVLCGHLQSVIPVCSGSVEDLLWAHLRIQIEGRVDKFLREHFSTMFANTSSANVLDILQSDFPVQELSMEQIFAQVNSLMEGKVESYYQKVRRHLMLGSYNLLVDDTMECIEDVDFNFVRFLAHFVLILREMGREPKRDVGDKILVKYLNELIKSVNGAADSPELLAFYASKLPNDSQIQLYSKLMSRIEGSSNRLRIMECGIRAGVNVEFSAIQTVKEAINILRGHMSTLFDMGSGFDKEMNVNKYVLDSLEWLTFSPNQIQDALYLSNSIIRTLIFMNDVEAAANVLARILQLLPHNTLSSINSNSNVLKEHLCLKAYLEAVDAFGNWYRRYIGGRPQSPEPLALNCSYTDKVHYDQKRTLVSQERSRWNKASLHQARHTKKIIYNVLLFPDGWLTDVAIENVDKIPKYQMGEISERKKQLATLRQLCLPEMTMLLLQVLQTGPEGLEGHIEAIRLANILASDKRGLYKVFTKDKLSEVLQKIKDSSIYSMENEKDPWGFEPLHV